MTNNQESRKHVKVLVICSLIISILMIICGYLKFRETTPYNVATKETRYISSEQEIKSLSEAMFNDECFLTKDIKISNPDTRIGTDEYPFEGVFDGNGHTIYLSYKTIDKGISLFGKIAKGAIIKNVNFVIESTTISVNTSLIARINEGTITNCIISFPNLEISAPSTVTPLISTNKGAISNVYVVGKFTNKDMNLENEKKTTAASLCIYNWGTINNSIVEVEYSGFKTTDKQAVLEGTLTNENFAAVIFSNVGICENNRVLVSDNTYLIDRSMDFVSNNDRKNVLNEETVFKTMNFDKKFWSLTNEKLLLIIAEG